MMIAIYRDIYDTIVLYIVMLYLCANDMHENSGRIIRIQFISKTKRGDSLAKKLGIPFFRKKTQKRKGLPSFPSLLLVSTLNNHFSFFSFNWAGFSSSFKQNKKCKKSSLHFIFVSLWKPLFFLLNSFAFTLNSIFIYLFNSLAWKYSLYHFLSLHTSHSTIFFHLPLKFLQGQKQSAHQLKFLMNISTLERKVQLQLSIISSPFSFSLLS